jgi:ribosome maturation factor RimP
VAQAPEAAAFAERRSFVPKARDIEEVVERLVGQVVEREGLLLYDIVFRQSGPRWKLQVFVDRPEGGIQLDDCAAVSRQLSRELDLADPIPHGYDLEVSSPGIERPLRRRSHWEAAVGFRVRLKWREESGRARTLVATLRRIEGEQLELADADEDVPIRVPLESVLSARLQPEF